MSDLTLQSIILKDGRKLGFAERGNPNGKPILLFVGGSSRLVHPPVEVPDTRLITVDRPGLGLSDFQPNRRLLDLPDDILQLVDALGIQQLAVVGISQGGPSALACAFKIPHRLVAVSAVSSLAPLPPSELQKKTLGPVATFSRLANDFPLALKLQSALAAWMVRLSPQWTFRQVLKSLPETDRAIFAANPVLITMFISDLQETYRQGSKGSAQEGLLAYRSWGFRLEDIRTKVYIWHGEADQSAPVVMGRYLANAIPNCQATYLADEGHFLGLKYWREIMAQLFSPT
jgi:pimeloyl-ACP methyl ester carboxylesterase